MAKVLKEKASTEVSTDVLNLFQEDAGSGLTDMGQEDLALPFLKVLSGNDPILDDADSGARKGDIFNTVTGEI